MLEDRLEQATRHSAALEEVQRRLKLVNKGLDHRLAQTKEELRGYNNDSKEMATMCKQIDAARDELSKRIRLMKAAMEQDRSKRTADMTRRQALVERSLAETNALGERVKAAEEEREKLQAEREAEEQLAGQSQTRTFHGEIGALLCSPSGGLKGIALTFVPH